jgi:hypothetical protein
LSGTDASLFTVNASTGVVSMIARNFESPADVGANNVYDYTLTATDADGNTDDQAVAVTVSDELFNFTLGQSVIDLGANGKLIAPVQVDGNNWYYYWDRNGNGTNTGDDVSHDAIDLIFNQDINGLVGGNGDTTDTYRYAMLNELKVALPTHGGTLSGDGTAVSGWKNGTSVGNSATPSSGSADVNATYNDWLAIWDAYNGTTTGSSIYAAPPDWYQTGYYLTSTPSPTPGYHALVSANGYVDIGYSDLNSYSVALQVL